MAVIQIKPGIWPISPAKTGATDLWRGLAVISPHWPGIRKRLLLGPTGQPINRAPTPSGTAWNGSPFGVALGNTNSADLRRLLYTGYAPITTSDGAGSGDFTMLSLCNPTPAATVAVALHQRLSGGAANQASLYPNTDNAGAAEAGAFAFNTWSTARSAVAASGVVDGNWHTWIGVRKAGVMSLYRDGVLIASSSMTVRNIYSATADFCIGGSPHTATVGLAITDDIGITGAWNRALSDAEIRLLACDPFCMLRLAERQKIYYIPAAGGADVRKKIISAYMRIAA